MTIGKKLRFEIFRRDNFTCRYCGASAPIVVITVDHIFPVSLGGTDAPDNLATACADCNAGKGATSVNPPATPESAAPDTPEDAQFVLDFATWEASLPAPVVHLDETDAWGDRLIISDSEYASSTFLRFHAVAASDRLRSREMLVKKEAVILVAAALTAGAK